MDIYPHTYTHFTLMQSQMHTHTHAYTRTHTHIHTQRTHTHTHTHTNTHLAFGVQQRRYGTQHVMGNELVHRAVIQSCKVAWEWCTAAKVLAVKPSL
jgi:hypothetical protein